MIGHIKLDRKILNWEWYHDNSAFRLFIHLLLIANHKDGKWQGNEIKRGQVITGLEKLSANTGLSLQQTRTAFDKLKSTGEITVIVTTKFRIVTICKYDTYQSSKNEGNKQDNNQNESQITNNQQPDNKQITTNNNGNNINNDKNKGVPEDLPPVVDISKSNLFRQPVIPTKQQVWECFSGKGGTKEMAKVFYDNNEGTGWFHKGSPITNFTNLVPQFIANWLKFENKNKPTDSTNVKIKC